MPTPFPIAAATSVSSGSYPPAAVALQPVANPAAATQNMPTLRTGSLEPVLNAASAPSGMTRVADAVSPAYPGLALSAPQQAGLASVAQVPLDQPQAPPMPLTPPNAYHSLRQPSGVVTANAVAGSPAAPIASTPVTSVPVISEPLPPYASVTSQPLQPVIQPPAASVLSNPKPDTPETPSVPVSSPDAPSPAESPTPSPSPSPYTTEQALSLVQQPSHLPTDPIDAAHSFSILPDGTIRDNRNRLLLPTTTGQPPRQPFWRQHVGALVGLAIGGVAGWQIHRQLRPFNLNRLRWTPRTPWPNVTEALNGIVQPVLGGVRRNRLLNTSLQWSKATAIGTPIIAGGVWGEREQREWRRDRQAQLVEATETVV